MYKIGFALIKMSVHKTNSAVRYLMQNTINKTSLLTERQFLEITSVHMTALHSILH